MLEYSLFTGVLQKKMKNIINMTKFIKHEERRKKMVNPTHMLVIFVDHRNLISDCQGEAAAIFGMMPCPFVQPGMRVLEIPWESVVEQRPDLNQAQTILRTLGGQSVLLSIIKLPRSSAPLDYLFVLCRLEETLGMEPQELSTLDADTGTLIRSDKMKKIIDIIHKIANVDSTVLLLGESGVGKSVLARLIHHVSSRCERAFLSINCGTLPDSLIESELFGYEAGSFTGGRSEGKKGLLETAEGGTVFLDEIAELPFHVQSKLLEVLQENTFRKIGSVEKQRTNIRIIAATNKDLRQMISEKSFREDLYYRLHVVPLTIPPLRERREDILPLAEHFVQVFNRKYDREFFLSSRSKQRLLDYQWPGNVRELENTIERMVVTHSNDIMEPWGEDSRTVAFPIAKIAGALPPLKEAKKQLEKELILSAYERYKNTYKAAEALQIDQSTIVKKLKQYRQEDKVEAERRRRR
jgi:transcriptional regulator with PAS, ATPase and Fis domain